MRLSTGIKFAIVVWLAAEALVFVLVAKVIGGPEALLIAVITSLFGWTLLKRAGASAMVKLRALLDGRASERDAPRFLDDGLATAGAVALLLPGFLSDIVGVVLSAPTAREAILRRLGRRPGLGLWKRASGEGRTGPSTIDLDRDEWERTESRRPVTKV